MRTCEKRSDRLTISGETNAQESEFDRWLCVEVRPLARLSSNWFFLLSFLLPLSSPLSGAVDRGSLSCGKEESRGGRSTGPSISLLTLSGKRKYQPLEAEMKHDSPKIYPQLKYLKKSQNRLKNQKVYNFLYILRREKISLIIPQIIVVVRISATTTKTYPQLK